MNLDEIDRMGRELFRNPELAIPMRDALEELGITWVQWLEHSHTLERIAECMVLAAGRHPGNALEHYVWRREIGANQGVAGQHQVYEQLCRAFHVPPVSVEVEIGRWCAPSAAVALAALRDHSRQRGDAEAFPETAETCRRQDAQATAFRVRVGRGPWIVTPL